MLGFDWCSQKLTQKKNLKKETEIATSCSLVKNVGGSEHPTVCSMSAILPAHRNTHSVYVQFTFWCLLCRLVEPGANINTYIYSFVKKKFKTSESGACFAKLNIKEFHERHLWYEGLDTLLRKTMQLNYSLRNRYQLFQMNGWQMMTCWLPSTPFTVKVITITFCRRTTLPYLTVKSKRIF